MTRPLDERALSAGAQRLREMNGHHGYEDIVQAVCDVVDGVEEAIVEEHLRRAVDRVPLVGPDETIETVEGRLDPIPAFHMCAVQAMRDLPVSVLTGPSGAERRRVLLIAADLHRETMRSVGVEPRVLVLASTRRDAMRMGPGATTVHDALGWDPVTRSFERDAFNPLDAELVVVDQADLLDRDVLTLLIAARGEAAVVLTRDPTMMGSTIPPSDIDVEMEDVATA